MEHLVTSVFGPYSTGVPIATTVYLTIDLHPDGIEVCQFLPYVFARSSCSSAMAK